MALALALPSWPILSVSYRQGTSESSREPKSFLPQTYLLDTIEVSLYYGRASWYAMLSSTYSLSTNRDQAGEKYLKLYHELSIAYYPVPALYMEVSVGLTEATSWPSRVQITTPSFNLSLTYGRLFDLFDLEPRRKQRCFKILRTSPTVGPLFFPPDGIEYIDGSTLP